MQQIILASGSPRRKEVLEKLGLPFNIVPSDYEEDMTLPLSPTKLAEHLSAGKARTVSKKNPEALIIGADSFVVFNDKLLGKPKTKQEAHEMLQTLSGKENDIITGVTIIDGKTDIEKSFHEITKVFMKELSSETINAYIETGESMDKAGAYALQELGALLIDHVEGNFFNAMGLPLARLAEELKQFGVKVL